MITLNGHDIKTYPPLMQDHYATWRFQAKLDAKIGDRFVVNGINYWHLLSHLCVATSNYFPTKPGTDFLIPGIRQIGRILAGKKKAIVEADDIWTAPFLQCLAIVCHKRGLIQEIRKKRERAGWQHILLRNDRFVKALLKGRLWARYAVGRLRRIRKKKYQGDRPSVLFLGNIRFVPKGRLENGMFISIAKQLDQRGISHQTLFYAPVHQIANFKRIIMEFLSNPAPYIGDYYDLALLKKNNNDLKKLRARWLQAKNDAVFRECFTYEGYDLFELYLPRLELIFNALGYAMCDGINAMQAVVGALQPKVFVTDHEKNLYGRAHMLNQREINKCKTLALSYELVPDPKIRKEKAAKRESPLWMPVPDIKCVWGEYIKQLLLKNFQMPATNIRITGNPKFDPLFVNEYDEKEIAASHGLSLNQPIILVVATVDYKKYSDYEKMARQNMKYLWVIKPHPNEDELPLREHFKRANLRNVVILHRNADIYELIALSKIVMSVFSTTAFEAAMIGKPVLLLNLNGVNLKERTYVPTEAAIEITTLAQLKNVLRRLESPQERKKFSKRLIDFTTKLHKYRDGKSGERVVDELVRLQRRSEKRG